MKNINNNLQNDNHSILSEALIEMEASTNTSSNPSDALSEMAASNSLPTEEVSQEFNIEKQLKILYEIERMMGQYLDSLKIVDQTFAQVADVFFNNANTITAKGKELTEDEIHELIASVIIGGVVKGFGNIWQNLKTSQQLANIKSILVHEANTKLATLKTLKEMNEAMWDLALNRFEQSTNFHECEINFQNFRVQQYILDLNYYLIDVYQEALNGQFTSLPFPSYYNTNKHILLNILSTTGEASSKEAQASEAAKSIKSLMDGVRESLKTDRKPTIEEFIIASDKQIMAVAIDLYINVDYTKDIADFNDDNESVYPESLRRIKLFTIYGLAEDNPTNPMSEHILKNEALVNSLIHCDEALNLDEEYENRTKLYTLNCYIIGIACFVASMYHFDIAWYWSLLIGIIALIVAVKCTPFSTFLKLCQYKATCIERKLSTDCRNISGYIETINLLDISSQNNKSWLYIILGAIVGLIVPIPFGWLIGAIIGGVLGSPIKDETPIDYDYTTIRLGYTWKAQTISAIFTAITIYYTCLLIF